MAVQWWIRKGDTYPGFIATLKEDNVVKDVSSGTVTLNARMKRGDKTPIVTGGVCSFVTDGTDGQITYSFTTEQTAKPGRIEIEVVVDFGGSVIGTWPSEGYFEGEIVNTID